MESCAEFARLLACVSCMCVLCMCVSCMCDCVLVVDMLCVLHDHWARVLYFVRVLCSRFLDAYHVYHVYQVECICVSFARVRYT